MIGTKKLQRAGTLSLHRTFRDKLIFTRDEICRRVANQQKKGIMNGPPAAIRRLLSIKRLEKIPRN